MSLDFRPIYAQRISPVNIIILESGYELDTSHFLLCSGIAANNHSQVNYFVDPARREDYDYFYEQLVRVKDIAVLSFAETAQRLLVIYIRGVLGQPRAAAWFEGTWTGDHRRWTLAHAGYAGSNNNMGQEVDWRDMKKEVRPPRPSHSAPIWAHSLG